VLTTNIVFGTCCQHFYDGIVCYNTKSPYNSNDKERNTIDIISRDQYNALSNNNICDFCEFMFEDDQDFMDVYRKKAKCTLKQCINCQTIKDKIVGLTHIHDIMSTGNYLRILNSKIVDGTSLLVIMQYIFDTQIFETYPQIITNLIKNKCDSL